MNSIAIRRLVVAGMQCGLAAGIASLMLAVFLGAGPLSMATMPVPGVDAAGVAGGVRQSSLEIAIGLVLNGLAVGGLAGLAFATALGRLGTLGPRGTAVAISGAAFVCGFLVPFVKYPLSPPGSTDSVGVGQRTAGYFAMVGISLLLAIAAFAVAHHVHVRLGWWLAGIAGIAAYVVAVALVMALLPSTTAPGPDFAGGEVWTFRLATIGIQASMWFVFGALFGTRAPALVAVTVPAADRFTTTRF